MRPGISITLNPSDRRRLEAIAASRNTPQKHVWRAEIVLLSAEGAGTVEIMRRTGTSKTCVWRWQEHFAAEGIDGFLRDKTRPSRVPPLGHEVIDRVAARTGTEPPHGGTHWTAAAIAGQIAPRHLLPEPRRRHDRGGLKGAGGTLAASIGYRIAIECSVEVPSPEETAAAIVVMSRMKTIDVIVENFLLIGTAHDGGIGSVVGSDMTRNTIKSRG